MRHPFSLFSIQIGLLTLILSTRPVSAWESPEHLWLGEQVQGSDPVLILLESHSRDFPEREKPAEQWPQRWRQLYDRGDADQKRMLTQGLTYGEAMALAGDFYADFNSLTKASLKELYQLIPMIHSRQTSTHQYQTTTGNRYLALAEENHQHFSLAKKGESNLDMWKVFHSMAIEHAQHGDFHRSWGFSAVAAHFLTDAFSGGHLRVPRHLLMKLKLGQVVSKVLHDLDNQHGVMAINRRGDTAWIAFGDGFLHRYDNLTNREKMREALRLCIAEIARALRDRSSYPADQVDRTAKQMWELVPIPLSMLDVSRWGAVPENRLLAALNNLPDPSGVLKKIARHIVRPLITYEVTQLEIALRELPGIVSDWVGGDTQIRKWVQDHSIDVLSQQPLNEKSRWIDRLMSGYASKEDGLAIVKICQSVNTLYEKRILREKNFRNFRSWMTFEKNVAQAKQILEHE